MSQHFIAEISHESMFTPKQEENVAKKVIDKSLAVINGSE
jgi:hypothetical protein